MTNEDSISAIIALVRERQTFIISSHARPDGDAIGSSLGLMHLLDALGKDVTVAFHDPIPEQFLCLAGVERIVHDLPETTPDCAILLECDSIQRTGYSQIDARFTINIDHHLSGRNYADFNWIDPQRCAVGAMVYDIAIAAGVKITTAMADCLYCAVLTDTGSFNFPSTTADTFALAEHLVQCGTNPNRIAQCMFFSYPLSKVRLLGTALSNMQIRGQISWSVISVDDMQRAGASAEDCEGVVNHLIGISGIEAAVLLRQQPSLNEYRLSLRSKGVGCVDVAKVAEYFGGGGHRNASGLTLQGTAASVTERVLEQLELQLPTPIASGQPTPATPSTLVA
jgi:bifunctional oligoribonuclease and PAP phosphatase NrnA